MNLKQHFTVLYLLLPFFINPVFNQTSDTTRINLLIAECKNLVYTDPNQVKLIVDTIYEESSRISYQYGRYSAFNYRGIANYMNAEYDESINNYKKALPFVNNQKPYQRLRIYLNIGLSLRALHLNDSAIYYNKLVCEEALENKLFKVYEQSILDLATIYLNKDDYIKAYSYYTDVEKYIENSTDSEFLIKAYSALAMFYYKVENFNLSYPYFQKAIEEDYKNTDLNFLGENYGNLGLLYQQVEKYDSAIYFYGKSIENANPIRRGILSIKANINIGNTYLDRNILDTAYLYYEKILPDSILNNSPESKSAVYTNLGILYLRNKDFQKARKFLNKGLKLSEKHDLLLFQKNAHRELAYLDSIQGNFMAELYHTKKYHLIDESLKIQDLNKQLAIVEFEKYLASEKYKNDLLTKENQNKSQEILIQKAIIGSILIIVLVLIIITFLVMRNRKKVKSLNDDLKESNIELEELNSNLQLQKKEMKELLMSKDRFVSILGHDLKNPFVGLLGLLDLIQQDWNDISEKDKKEGIQQLYRSSLQTYQLLEDLLDWGKTQEGLFSAVRSEFQLQEVFNEVRTIFHMNLKKKNIDLVYQLPLNFKVNTDKKLLSQILQNFIGNAIKYSHPGNQVLVKAKDENDVTKICVTDFGIGIPEDKIQTLFDLGKHFNRPGTQNEKSTGMGLILCKEYAKILDAEIIIESEVNSGSTFCLLLSGNT